ncbi:Zn finger protein [Gnomoniopsis sp. IMI 355080]|nr:Zn finger protein [Gnomoniopsis sp. IMI 355080]
MADLVMPRLPDNQQSWFHQPPHYSPTGHGHGHGHGHQRSNSYHMPRQQQQQQQQQQLQQQYQQQNQYQQTIQQPQQRVSPPFASNSSDISPLSTSNNTSPVSPKNYHGRQVRPLYMPAVLRPNEFPAGAHVPKASPTGEEVDDDERVVRSSGSFTSLSGILSLSRLSRRSTNDSGKVVDWNWDLSNYAPVSGEPTRRHWKADAESDVCDDPTCKKYFNYFVRRHHCRRCGNIFCDPHSMQFVPLDESANFNPRGNPVRACNHCFLEFMAWRSRSNSPASSMVGGSRTPQQHQHQHQPHGGSKTMPASPISAASPMPGASPTTPGKTQPEVALSVPSDWNWSTF